MAGHTPGPWEYDPDAPAIFGPPCDNEWSDGRWKIVDLLGAMGGDDSDADARLIASAPELLEALEGMLDGLPATENEYELVQAGLDPTEARKVAAAFAATRKARGDAA